MGTDIGEATDLVQILGDICGPYLLDRINERIQIECPACRSFYYTDVKHTACALTIQQRIKKYGEECWGQIFSTQDNAFPVFAIRNTAIHTAPSDLHNINNFLDSIKTFDPTWIPALTRSCQFVRP